MNHEIIIKRAGKPVQYATADLSDYKEIQKLVGGFFEVVRLPDGILLIVNEEGRIRNLPLNLTIADYPFYGDVFFCSSIEDEMVGLTDYQMESLLEILHIDKKLEDFKREGVHE